MIFAARRFHLFSAFAGRDAGRKTARLVALFLATGALSACDFRDIGNLNINSAPSSGDKKLPVIQRNAQDGNVELVLHPVLVWDEDGASPPKTVASKGRKFIVRHRRASFLEKPYARAGLFWHSRLDYIFMPIVVLEAETEIRQVEIRAGANRANLRPAKDDFKFTPARTTGGGEVSAAVFELKPKTLRAISGAEEVRLIINTNHGVLNLGLDVVSGNSPDDYRRNARTLFADFAAQMAAEQAGG